MDFFDERVIVRGKATQVLIAGSGPPLLYLHSAGGEVVPLPFFEALAERFRLYIPAHPGFSESGGLEEIDSMEDLVFHTTDLMELLEIQQPAVVGLSLGGWLSAELATRFSDRMSAMVLIAPVGLRPPVGDIFSASPKETRQLVFSDPEGELAKSFIPDEADGDAIAMAQRARRATARLGWNPYLHNRKLEGRLYRIDTPTLVMAATEDRLVPEEHCRLYRDGIRDAEFVSVPGAGHAIPFELPIETAKVVTEFLLRQ